MVLLGVAFNLLAAMMHAAGFVMNRLYVVKRHTSPVRLLVISHVWMGLASGATLLVVWPDEMPALATYGWSLLNAVWPYLVAQVFFFTALRRSDASQVAPLLGLKIVFVALLSVTWSGQVLGGMQWAAVLIAVGAAFVLNYSGGKAASLPAVVIGLVMTTVFFFSVSDIFIKEMLIELAVVGDYRGPLIASLLYWLLSGLIVALATPWLGSRAWADWRAAIPFSIVWLVGTSIMFIGFAAAGIVLGNIALATRGVWAVVLGAVIAHLGHHHLEQKVSRAAVARRIVGATAMGGAIVLYVWA